MASQGSEQQLESAAATTSRALAPPGGGEEPNKRTALAGQWRTPPLPVFPTGLAPGTTAPTTAGASPSATVTVAPAMAASAAAVAATASSIPVSLPSVAELPESTEDYEKALQEAYRRGAQAAAAMSHHAVHHHIAQPQPQPQPPQPLAAPPAVAAIAAPPPPTVPIAAPAAKSDVTTILPVATTAATNPAAAASMPPPASAAPKPPSPAQQHPVAAHQISLPVQPPPRPVYAPPPQQRSVSMPEMTQQKQVFGEEEKRQKRLARNRASAKLRRMRKKNLVDAYEAEVGVLERTLKQLKAHEWGAAISAAATTTTGDTNSHRALTEALSMDRGNQVLTMAERQQAARDLLQQQLQYIALLEEMMQEQYVLYKLAETAKQQFAATGDTGNVKVEEDAKNDADQLSDLMQALQLTPPQVDQLLVAKAKWHEEWQALATVKASLQAMLENNWLWSTGCMNMDSEFLSILHKNQVSKFLLWADSNQDSIDELDGVYAPSTVPQGPIFAFGVSQATEGVDEESRPTQG